MYSFYFVLTKQIKKEKTDNTFFFNRKKCISSSLNLILQFYIFTLIQIALNAADIQMTIPGWSKEISIETGLMHSLAYN